MAYSSILVQVDKDPGTRRRVALAARLAKAGACSLIAVFGGFIPDPMWFYLMDSPQDLVEEDLEERRKASELVRSECQAMTDALSVATEWRRAEFDAVGEVLRESREAGLIVAGQYDATNIEGPMARQILEATILESGRPVLVFPYVGEFTAVGARVVIAWNGSREAARALHDAIPLIAGGTACVICAQAADKEARPDATPLDHATRVLQRHGVTVEVETCMVGTDISIGELLLSRAEDFSADLIVMGAYGHGRIRELVLGGVTRAILASMTVPVLFSH
jgi:nucleotide-binding universal stress UspA family protein